MKKSPPSHNYPSVNSWNFITIEGYCMLNMEYGGCHYRYDYQLNPDGTFKPVKNPRYDPGMKPDPYPPDCKQSIRSSCIECVHFAWCDPEEKSVGKIREMPNITLSLPDKIYKIVKAHNEVRWSEIARRAIEDYAKKIAILNAMTEESELTTDGIMELDRKVNAGIQKHYKGKASRSAVRKTDSPRN